MCRAHVCKSVVYHRPEPIVRSGKSHACPVSTSNTSRKAVLLLLQKTTRENMHRYMAQSIRTKEERHPTLAIEDASRFDAMRYDRAPPAWHWEKRIPPTNFEPMQLVSSKRTNLCQSTSQSTCTTKSIVSTPPSRLQEAAKR